MALKSWFCLILGISYGIAKVDGSFVLKHPEAVAGLDLGLVTPSYRYLGMTWQRAQLEDVKIRWLVKEDVMKVCGHPAKMSAGMFESDELLMMNSEAFEGTEFTARRCFSDATSEFFREVSHFSGWCSLNALGILISSDNIPGLFYNDHDGIRFAEMKVQFNYTGCALLEFSQTTDAYEVYSAFARSNPNTTIVADVFAGDSACAGVFSNFLVQAWWRGVLTAIYLFLGVSSMMYLFGTKSRGETGQFVNYVTLLANFLTMFILGISFLNGSWRISDSVSHDMNQFLLNAFFGTQCACDFLIAARWNEIKHANILTRKISKATLVKRYIVVLVAISLIIVDWSNSIMFVFMNERNQDTLQFYIPVLFFIMQLLILPYLVNQIYAMIKMLKEMAKAHKLASTVTENQKADQERKMKLVRKLQFWLIVSVVSSVISLAVLLIFALTSVWKSSCEGWVLVWSAFFLSKAGNSLSQLRVCAPSMVNSNGNKVGTMSFE